LELAKDKVEATADVAALKAKVASAKSHAMDDVASTEKRLVGFEAKLTQDLANLCEVYERNIESIDNLCSPILDNDPSVDGYLRWFTVEVASLPEVFSVINDNFILAAVEDGLIMAGDSVDLTALQATTTVSGADILPGGQEIQKTARAITRRWWHAFGFDATLTAIQAKLREVNCCVRFFCLQNFVVVTLLLLFLVLQKRAKAGGRVRADTRSRRPPQVASMVIDRIASKAAAGLEGPAVADAVDDGIEQYSQRCESFEHVL
jgi:hypothetical protein